MADIYVVTDEFQVKERHIITLDRDFDSCRAQKAIIDGVPFEYELNSVRKWVALKTSSGSFRGKQIAFE